MMPRVWWGCVSCVTVCLGVSEAIENSLTLKLWACRHFLQRTEEFHNVLAEKGKIPPHSLNRPTERVRSLPSCMSGIVYGAGMMEE